VAARQHGKEVIYMGEKLSFTWEKSYWKKAHIVTTEQGRVIAQHWK
jgi:hypothetical protein